MPLVNSNQFGQSYKFGFQDADAPTIVGFVPRAAELRWEAETFSAATDGEGLADSITTTKPDKRKITATFSGYIRAGFDASAISHSFTFQGRFYIVRNITDPRRKGEYNEASLECESYANVTSVAA
jgi:hypothetical protein